MTATPEPFTLPDLVALDLAGGGKPEEVVRSLTDLLAQTGRVTDADAFVEAVMAREALEPTALPGGIAIPHSRSDAVATLSVAVGRLASPITFAAGKPSVDVVLLIAAPDEDPSLYLKVLAKIAGSCVKSSFRTAPRTAETSDEVAALVTATIGRL